MKKLTQTLSRFVSSVFSDPDRYHTDKQPIYPDEFDHNFNQRHGGEYLQMYDEACRDTQALTLLQKRVEAFVSRDWEISPGGNSAMDKRIADRIASELERNRFGFDKLCSSLAFDAFLYGIGAVEMIWTKREDGLLFPSAWTTVRIDRLRLVANKGWHIRTRESPHKGVKARVGQLIIQRHRDGGGTWPYGRGMGGTLWWLAWFKRQLLVSWLSGAQKTGDPSIIGTTPAGLSDSDRSAFNRALAALRSSDSATIPEGANVQLLERRSGKGEIYLTLWRELDMAMSKLVLGETLTTEMGSTGSYAAASVHDTVSKRRAKADNREMCETLNEQLISLIYSHNWGGDKPPVLQRDFFEPADLQMMGKGMKELKVLGYVPADKKAFARRRLGGDWTHEEGTSEMPNTARRANMAEDKLADLRAAAFENLESVERLADAAAPDEPWTHAVAGLIQAMQSADLDSDKLLDLLEDYDPPEWREILHRALLAAELHGRHIGSAK